MISFNDRLAVANPEGNNEPLHFFKHMGESKAKIVLTDQTMRWATRDYLNDSFEL